MFTVIICSYISIYKYIFIFTEREREDFYTCQGKAAVKEEVKRRERKEQKKRGKVITIRKIAVRPPLSAADITL